MTGDRQTDRGHVSLCATFVLFFLNVPLRSYILCVAPLPVYNSVSSRMVLTSNDKSKSSAAIASGMLRTTHLTFDGRQAGRVPRDALLFFVVALGRIVVAITYAVRRGLFLSLILMLILILMSVLIYIFACCICFACTFWSWDELISGAAALRVGGSVCHAFGVTAMCVQLCFDARQTVRCSMPQAQEYPQTGIKKAIGDTTRLLN